MSGPQQFLNPTPTEKIKVKNDPKIKQKPIPELTETYKMKVEQLHK